MYRINSIFLTLCLILGFTSVTEAFEIEVRAAVLMEAATGRVFYAQNDTQRFPPASVTKLMTMLLIMEAVDKGRIKWTDKIPTTKIAAGMGGSQIFLREKEELPLREMMKAIAVVSANDASTAVAEYLYGTDLDFVEAMNKRAQKLGLKNTHFANETGLPNPQHYSSAYDLALISHELIKYPEIFKFTTIWLDSLREGKFVLRNTNKLIKYYQGADGLKTGHTDEAKFCLAATAKRDNLRLIAVIMGAESDGQRLFQTRRLFDYGFRNYEWKQLEKAGKVVGELKLKDAQPEKVPVKLKNNFGLAIERERKGKIQTKLVRSEKIALPIKAGQPVGVLQATNAGKIVAVTPVYSTIEVKRANFIVKGWRSLIGFFGDLFTGKLFRK